MTTSSSSTSFAAQPSYRIWLDTACTVCALVSFEDYEWALQWKWQITWDRHKRKMYATRSTTTGEVDHHGRKKRIKIYLHKAVLERSGKPQPCGKHTMGDHGDGDSLNCQRDNLDWATPSMNRKTARKPKPEPVEDTPF